MTSADPFSIPPQAWEQKFVGFEACALGAIAVTELGEVRCYGRVPHCGDLADAPLRSPVCGLVLEGTGRGYRIVLENGDSYVFRDLPPHQRTGPVLEELAPHRDWFER